MSRVLPILFNTDMVRAILDGRKTVTRRVVKLPKHIKPQEDGLYTLFADGTCYENQSMEEIINYLKAPYQPGDILYVRETWRVFNKEYFFYNQTIAFKYKDGTHSELIHIKDKELFKRLVKQVREKRNRYHPSIHMPKEAARIWLKVTDVRVERLRDITEEQAIKEGISRLYDDLSDAEYIEWAKRTGIYPKAKADWGYKNYLWHGNFGTCGTGNWKSDNWDYQYSSYDNAIGSFSSLWNSTLKKSDLDRYGWKANPWVWVIEFERCEKPESEG